MYIPQSTARIHHPVRFRSDLKPIELGSSLCTIRRFGRPIDCVLSTPDDAAACAGPYANLPNRITYQAKLEMTTARSNCAMRAFIVASERHLIGLMDAFAYGDDPTR